MSLDVPESALTTDELGKLANFRRDLADAIDSALAEAAAGGGLDLATRRTLHATQTATFMVGANAAGWTQYNTRDFVDGQSWDDYSMASFTSRVYNHATGLFGNGAAATDAPIQTHLFAFQPAGNLNITGWNAAEWNPGGGDGLLCLIHGGYGGAQDAAELASTVTLKHEAALSAAANRMSLPGSVDIVLAWSEGIVLRYDTGLSRWVPVVPV